MQSEFHQFVNLPTELRLIIWKYALRPISPTLPGAHFFSVPNNDEDGEIINEFKVQCHLGPDCEAEHDYLSPLTAPKFGSCHSWTSNNPSAYLWDFGMWSACQESREIIEKHYKMEYWKMRLHQEKVLGNGDSYLCNDVDVCIPFFSPRRDGNWCFSIHPNRDLVCLQPTNAKHIRFYKDYEHINDFCIVGWDMTLRGFANLAFEYDSSWYDGLDKIHNASDLFKEMSPRGLFIRTIVSMDDRDYCAPRTLWLIDYSLKRDKERDDHSPSEEGKVFHGSDRRFVQVDLYSRDYSDAWSCSALEFIQDVDLLFDDRPKYCCLYRDVYDSDRSYGGDGGYFFSDQVRVLACEEGA
ncbi:hypothetical protein TrVFT333_006066 [Trichoderma virens FT-333]|nr:hypothetical protein TrVFT333_006066 [Trichoderma virens FT-333]